MIPSASKKKNQEIYSRVKMIPSDSEKIRKKSEVQCGVRNISLRGYMDDFSEYSYT